MVERLYVTQVHATVEGDTHFPAITDDNWQLQDQQDHQADEKNYHDYCFMIYHRDHGTS